MFISLLILILSLLLLILLLSFVIFISSSSLKLIFFPLISFLLFKSKDFLKEENPLNPKKIKKKAY